MLASYLPRPRLSTAVFRRYGLQCNDRTHSYRWLRLFQPCHPRPISMSAKMNARDLELPTDKPVEEETIPGYVADDFYPVSLGEVFASRYKVLSKLGFGTGSTVWLCKDLQSDAYHTLKVCIRKKDGSLKWQQAATEIAASRHIQQAQQASADLAAHPGKTRVRVVTDAFQVQSAHGEHQCLLYSPQGMSFTDLRDLWPGGVFEKRLLQNSLQLILISLDYLHRCQVVHTDISPNNILVGAHDQHAFSRMEESEIKEPLPRKTLQGRTIYISRPAPVTNGLPVLVDLGSARFGQEKYNGDIMPWIYRSPEVILGMDWTNKVDIWSMGVMIWDLFEDKHLFYARNREGVPDDEHHLAEMVALMGPPPPAFLQRSSRCKKYWDDQGNWIASTPIPEQSLESRETRLDGEDKDLLVEMARAIFRWLPEERPAADELAYAEFLMQAYFAAEPQQE